MKHEKDSQKESKIERRKEIKFRAEVNELDLNEESKRLMRK